MSFRDANEEEAELFITAIRARNWSLLRKLIHVQHPCVLWGAVMRRLTPKQRTRAQHAFHMHGTFTLTSPSTTTAKRALTR